MRTIGGVFAGIELFKHGLDFHIRKTLVRADGAMTGHELDAVVNSLFHSVSGAVFNPFLHHFHHQGFNVTFPQNSRYRLDGKGITPKGFDLEAQGRKLGKKFVKNFCLPVVQVNGFGYQQAL